MTTLFSSETFEPLDENLMTRNDEIDGVWIHFQTKTKTGMCDSRFTHIKVRHSLIYTLLKVRSYE